MVAGRVFQLLQYCGKLFGSGVPRQACQEADIEACFVTRSDSRNSTGGAKGCAFGPFGCESTIHSQQRLWNRTGTLHIVQSARGAVVPNAHFVGRDKRGNVRHQGGYLIAQLA